MKFLIFSDIHIHPWPAFSGLNEDGINTRLAEGLEALCKILKAAHSEKVDAILFAGDLFHIPKVDAVTLDLTTRVFMENRHPPIIMIPGNHDEASKMNQMHLLRSFNKRSGDQKIFILDDFNGSTANDFGVKGIPYTSSRKKLMRELRRSEGTDIVLCHTGFANATAGSDYIAEQKEYIRAGKLSQLGIGLIVAGHFHRPQFFVPGEDKPAVVSECEMNAQPGTVLIPGAPMQHNFGDAGDPFRGYWIYDSKKRQMEFRDGGMPEFIKLKTGGWSGDLVEIIKGNYVSYTATNKEDHEKVLSSLKEGARGFSITLDEAGIKVKGRMNVSLATNRRLLLKRYIRKHPEQGLKRSRLLTAGLEILREMEAQ